MMTARILHWPKRKVPDTHVRTFWTLKDLTGQSISCQLWAVPTGLELRSLSDDEPCQSVLCSGSHAEVEAAMHAEDWRRALVEAGFCQSHARSETACD